MKYLPWGVLILALAVGYGYHQKQVGILQGEIHARGESIKQLSQLAAKKDADYRTAVAKYRSNPTPEGCSLVMLTCDQRDSTKTQQIAELNKQVEALTKRGKPSVLSKVPWVGIGFLLGKVVH